MSSGASHKVLFEIGLFIVLYLQLAVFLENETICMVFSMLWLVFLKCVTDLQQVLFVICV